MTRFDIILGKENTGKEEKNKLKLELEEGEDVLACIKEGMDNNKVKEANVVGIDGKLLEGTISENEKNIIVEDAALISAKGKFKFGGDELWGKINVFTEGKKPVSGQLLKGKAKEGLTINLEY
jgi:high-affinity K+ transport system ATPase subunit B